MFGNTLGWIISAAITGLAGFGTYLLILAGVPTPPTGFAETASKPLVLTAAAVSVVPTVTDTNSDAGELYREAILDYHDHPDAYDRLQHNQDYASAKTDAAALSGLDRLMKASTSRCIGLFAGKPQAVINFDAKPDGLEAIDAIGKTAGMMSALAKSEKDYKAARDYANAVLVLGVRLYQERLAYLELAQGESLIGLGIAALGDISEAEHAPASTVDAQEAFRKVYLDESSQLIQPVGKVMFDIGDAAIGEHAGDMFQLATESRFDRVWRVEAIHRLGRLRFNARSKADQIKAARVLMQLSTDPGEGEIIHLAAAQSLNMTAGDYQSQR